MKPSENGHESSSACLTIIGVLLALLLCMLGTSMVAIVYPQSFSFVKIALAQVDATPLESVGDLLAQEPTPFQPAPTSTATPEPEPTTLPTLKPTQAAPQFVSVDLDGTDAEIPLYANVGMLAGRPQLYTLDCESQAAVDWARFFGTSISHTEFIKRLPLSDDPEIGFVGQVNGAMGQLPPNDYGVHAPPVAALLREYGLPAKAQRGLEFDDIKREVAAGRPVIAWIVNMPFEIDAREYTASNGNTTTVARFEHTWIILAYNANTVTVVDGEWTYNVKIPTFLQRWEALGSQAILYRPD